MRFQKGHQVLVMCIFLNLFKVFWKINKDDVDSINIHVVTFGRCEDQNDAFQSLHQPNGMAWSIRG